MELANIVYSITLIFFLLLISIFLVGFLGSQYRKYQLNYSNRKENNLNGTINTNSERSTSELFTKRVIRPIDKIMMTYTNSDYSHIRYKKVSKDRIKAEPVKKVKRGSLVKEHYNSRMFTNPKNGINRNGIDFN